MFEEVQRKRTSLAMRIGLVAFLMLAGATQLALAAAPQAPRVAVGDAAIDFTMQSIDGETYRLSDLRGEKNVIVIFFRGTW